MPPKVTVILPVYNGMPYLPKAVESVLGQSFTDFTVVIVNDGSKDDSRNYLDMLNDPRIVIINQENAGQGAARNAALKLCHSEYVAVMDQDDVSLPDRLATQVRYLDEHPDIVLLGTQIDFLIGDTSQRGLKAPLCHEEIVARLLRGRAGICHPSLMYRTSAAIACGGYPTGVFGEDIDFCLRILEYGHAANLDSVLFQYRLHPAQASLARCKELISANAYAAYCTVCRRSKQPAPTLNQFLHNASLISRARWSLEAWELIQYRTARIRMASGRPVSGALRMAFLGFCRPLSSIRHIIRSI